VSGLFRNLRVRREDFKLTSSTTQVDTDNDYESDSDPDTVVDRVNPLREGTDRTEGCMRSVSVVRESESLKRKVKGRT